MAPLRSIQLGLLAATLLAASPAVAETVMVQRWTRVKARPTEEADTVMRVKQDRPARVIRRGGGWVKIRIGDEVGWVPRSQIEEEEQADEEEEEEEDAGVEEEAEDEELPGGEEKPVRAGPRFSAQAALGLRDLSSVFSSDGAMQLGNYRLSARAFTAAVGFEAVAFRSGPILVMLDARYQGSVASPGVQFATGEEGTGYVPFTTHDIDVGARVAYGFGWLRAGLRAGYHADILHVEKLDNVGKMPRETLTGTTIGVAVELPFTGSGWSARLSYDWLVGGKRKQTPGLEDGVAGTARASWTALAVGHALSSNLSAELGYRRARWTSSWSGTSAREADISSARRTDTAQQLTIGVVQSF